MGPQSGSQSDFYFLEYKSGHVTSLLKTLYRLLMACRVGSETLFVITKTPCLLLAYFPSHLFPLRNQISVYRLAPPDGQQFPPLQHEAESLSRNCLIKGLPSLVDSKPWEGRPCAVPLALPHAASGTQTALSKYLLMDGVYMLVCLCGSLFRMSSRHLQV